MGRTKRPRKRTSRNKTRPETPARPRDRSLHIDALHGDVSFATSRRTTLLCCLTIALATAVAFSPAIHNEFVDWDDFQNLTRNKHIRALSIDNLSWMATTGYMAVWQPVSWFVTALQYKLFDGADEAAFSRGMHVANIVLHGIASMLCFLVLQRLLAIGTPADTRRSPNAIACASLIG
ncbi:MAG: hypothetical protein O7D94_07350, partial [Planctomycetota bacterium]|nr:hypothetical protein [Planctomycetota bacterium]